MISLSEIKRCESDHNFRNVISLGYFCAPAMQLEKHGFRNASYPFDWLIITDFKLVLQLLDNGFENSDFLNITYFAQAKLKKNYYQNTKTGVRFLHEFNEFNSLSSQFDSFSAKYQRRMNRFQEDIKKSTLFIRYISGATELEYIEDNLESIDAIIKHKCFENEILYVCDNKLNPKIDIFTTIVESGLVNYKFMEDSEYSLIEWLKKNYSRPLVFRKKKNNILKKINKHVEGAFRKKYTHHLVYDDLD